MSSTHSLASPLDDVARDVLTVLSLTNHHVTRSAWQDLLRRADIVDAGGKGLHGESFKALVEDLLRSGVIRKVFDSAYTIDTSRMPAILESAARAGRVATIAARLAPAHSWSSSRAYGASSLSLVADLRRALAEDDAAAIGRVVARCALPMSQYEPWDWTRALGLAVPRAWLDRLPQPARDEYLTAALHVAFTRAEPVDQDVLDAACASTESGGARTGGDGADAARTSR